MSKNFNDIVRALTPAHGEKVEARAAELIAEEMTLRELRRMRKLTQVGEAEPNAKQTRRKKARV
jgi:hypothetical protein